MNPPPPADEELRDKPTIPPLPTDKRPPEDLLKLSETVFTRLGDVELALKGIEAALVHRLVKVDELHALLFGTPAKPGGKPGPNIVSAMHELSGNVGVAGVNAELAVERQKNLPQLVAQEVANRLVGMYQAEMRSLHEADNAALDRIRSIEDRIAELGAGPNGSAKPK
jgi:hypothetical protein